MRSEHEHSNPADEYPDEYRVSPVLAENVKRLRMKAKINKKKFALMVNIGRPFLNKIEDGTANPRLSVITRLADALDTTVDYLVTSHDAEEPQNPSERKATSGRPLDMRHARPY